MHSVVLVVLFLAVVGELAGREMGERPVPLSPSSFSFLASLSPHALFLKCRDPTWIYSTCRAGPTSPRRTLSQPRASRPTPRPPSPPTPPANAVAAPRSPALPSAYSSRRTATAQARSHEASSTRASAAMRAFGQATTTSTSARSATPPSSSATTYQHYRSPRRPSAARAPPRRHRQPLPRPTSTRSIRPTTSSSPSRGRPRLSSSTRRVSARHDPGSMRW